ncbi:MAG TPA: hypothetical protein DDZ58_05095 [Achromobacter sp.]|nr:hypothetical protein [Achromobacter sp.]
MTGPEKEDLYTQRAYYSQHKCKSNIFAYKGLPLLFPRHGGPGSTPWQRPMGTRPHNHSMVYRLA